MPTKTHRALEAMDIIHVILSHLIDDKRPGDRIENLLLNNANDLLSMAICCKAFEGPSLDLLWREMRSVTPLLRLLSTKATPHESLTVSGSLKSSDIPPRFYEYAKRIQHLSYTIHAEFDPIHPSTWIRLSQIEGGFLPRLRSLKILHNLTSPLGKERALIMLSALLTSRSVDSINIDMPIISSNDVNGLGPALAIVTDYNLDIETLSLNGTLPPDYTNHISTMQTLRSVTLKLSGISATFHVLASLTSLPRLVSLTLDITTTSQTPAQLYKFQSLTEFTLCGTLQVVRTVIGAMTIPHLEFINLSIIPENSDAAGNTSSGNSQETTMFQLSLWRFFSLKKVHIHWRLWNTSPFRKLGKKNVTGFTKSLLRLPLIEELVLTSLQPYISFSDRDIAEISAAWPELRLLRLDHQVAPYVPQPPLTSLTDLVANCTRLTELSLTLQDELLPNQKLNTISTHGLVKLDLQHTNIRRHARVVRLVDGLFPNLVDFNHSGQTDRDLVRSMIFELCHPVRHDQVRREYTLDERNNQALNLSTMVNFQGMKWPGLSPFLKV